MFLKSEPLKRNGRTIALYELSASQHIEHLERLRIPESITGADVRAAMDMTIKPGALLTIISL